MARIRSVVVLPAPFGPTSPKISPSADVEVEAGDGERLVVALHEARRPHDAGHRTVPSMRIGNWNEIWSWRSLTNLTWTSPLAASTQRAGSGSS